MRRRALDTSGLTDAGRLENLIEQVLTSPPPYRAAPGRPVYLIHAGDRAVLVGEQDLTGPLADLVETILETGGPPLAAERAPHVAAIMLSLPLLRRPNRGSGTKTQACPARRILVGDVHLVGGSRTNETFRALGALDELELAGPPLLFGAGLRLTPSLSPDTGLTVERDRALPGGSVEIVYACQSWRGQLPGRPASQRLNA